jgi:hypothetical protein
MVIHFEVSRARFYSNFGTVATAAAREPAQDAAPGRLRIARHQSRPEYRSHLEKPELRRRLALYPTLPKARRHRCPVEARSSFGARLPRSHVEVASGFT